MRVYFRFFLLHPFVAQVRGVEWITGDPKAGKSSKPGKDAKVLKRSPLPSLFLLILFLGLTEWNGSQEFGGFMEDVATFICDGALQRVGAFQPLFET